MIPLSDLVSANDDLKDVYFRLVVYYTPNLLCKYVG